MWYSVSTYRFGDWWKPLFCILQHPTHHRFGDWWKPLFYIQASAARAEVGREGARVASRCRGARGRQAAARTACPQKLRSRGSSPRPSTTPMRVPRRRLLLLLAGMVVDIVGAVVLAVGILPSSSRSPSTLCEHKRLVCRTSEWHRRKLNKIRNPTNLRAKWLFHPPV